MMNLERYDSEGCDITDWEAEGGMYIRLGK